jgi:phosphoribosylformylglycinamidine cyclo-ligase
MSEKKKSAYEEAGVNIDVMMGSLERIKADVKSTNTPDVLSEIGAFGGLYQAPGSECALVASVDGVGTKLMVAAAAGRHDTVGQDLVNHCVDDILVQGARPLYFMDYLGTATLNPDVFEAVIGGFAKACRENGCALLGGETAEMPGLYPQGEYDLVGAITGVVEKAKLIDGSTIKEGDVLIGLPSTGLHTNGFSLARKVIFEKAGKELKDIVPGTDVSFEDALLAVHKSYLHPVMALLEKITVQGMAHITGGGLYDNVPRVLPKNVDAVFNRAAWKVPALFQFIQDEGNVDRDEMYRVFNMGIGMVLFIRAADKDAAIELLKAQGETPIVIGEVKAGSGKSILEN